MQPPSGKNDHFFDPRRRPRRSAKSLATRSKIERPYAGSPIDGPMYGGDDQVMMTGISARLATILVQEQPWPEALACLAGTIGGEVAVALEAGSPPRRLGSFGPLSPAVSYCADEPALIQTLERVGMSSLWSRTVRRDRAPSVVLAVASRRIGGFAAADVAQLDEAMPIVEMKLAMLAAQAATEV